jgi:nitrite reductase (NO-forming)
MTGVRPVANRSADAPPRGSRPGTADRVAQVHRQARATLRIAAAFTVAAPLAAVVPHDTGVWLPLHLFLVGGLLGAISGAAPMLAVTWSASTPPNPMTATIQRLLLAAGTVAIAAGREGGSDLVTGFGGACVVTALFLLAVILLRVRATATVSRFRPAIDAYVVALFLGIMGSAGGVALATHHADAARGEASHAVTNLLGLVGIVIAATVPWFVATQARTRMTKRARKRALRASTAWLAGSTVAAGLGLLLEDRVVAGTGLTAYACGVAALFALVPRLGRPQLRWAGPRLVQLLAGLLWWVVTVGLLAAGAYRGAAPSVRTIEALVVGAYAQILVASLAYLAPVLRGGGHVRLGEGFAATRSWPALVLGNLAAVAALAGTTTLMLLLLLLWAADVAWRSVHLHTRTTQSAGKPS